LNQWLSDEEGLSKSQSHKAKLLDGRNSPENMSTSAPAAADRTPKTVAMTRAEHRAPFRPECRGVLRSLTHLVASQGGCLPVQPILADQAAFRGLSRGPQSARPVAKPRRRPPGAAAARRGGCISTLAPHRSKNASISSKWKNNHTIRWVQSS